jgi:hypothetical protein
MFETCNYGKRVTALWRDRKEARSLTVLAFTQLRTPAGVAASTADTRAGPSAAPTGLRAVVTGEFDRFKQWLITRVTAEIRCRPPCSCRHLSCCSKDCPLTGPSHAAESRLNQPAEFVARAGSWFR